MIALSPQARVYCAMEAVDFRNGIDGLARLCRTTMDREPMEGGVFLFRNRRRTAVKMLFYDGQGFWLCLKRLSTGRFGWWGEGPGDGGKGDGIDGLRGSGVAVERGSGTKRSERDVAEDGVETLNALRGRDQINGPCGARFFCNGSIFESFPTRAHFHLLPSFDLYFSVNHGIVPT
jgi:transposase